VAAIGSACVSIPVTATATSSSSTRPLGRLMRASRSEIRNTALHTIAHVSAISSTIRVVVVLWRRNVEMMGSTSMVDLTAT
jgi:hypothetical protein